MLRVSHSYNTNVSGFFFFKLISLKVNGVVFKNHSSEYFIILSVMLITEDGYENIYHSLS